MHRQQGTLDGSQTECSPECLYGCDEFDAAGHADHGLRGDGYKGHRALNHAPQLLLDVTQRILQLLLLSGIGLGQFCIHVADIGGNHLCQHGGTFAFRAILKYMCLCFVKRDAHTLQHSRLPLHGLTHHVADTHGILVGSIEAVLLGNEVIHGRYQHVKAFLLLQKRGHLLGTTELYFVADDTQFLLGRTKVFDMLYLLIGAIHALPHDGL